MTKSLNYIKGEKDIKLLNNNYIKSPITLDKESILKTGSSNLLEHNKNHLILYPNGSLGGELMHEMGHINNGKSNIIKRSIHNISNNKKHLSNLNSLEKFYRIGNKNSEYRTDSDNNSLSEIGIRKALSRYLYGRVRLKEEENATNWGLNKMNNLGVDKNIISSEGNFIKKNEDSIYTIHNLRAYWKIPLRNKIQIPSRRGDFGSHVYHLK